MNSLSSSSVNVTNTESASPVDDDGSLSVTAGLAKDAAVLFQSGKYAECVKVLNQLLQSKADDPKVLHNIAIVEAFQDGCSDPKRFLEVLNNVKKRSEELTAAYKERLDTAKGITSSTANQVSAAANSSPIVYTAEFDTSVTMYNIAVTWFYLHKYAKVVSILEPLYQNIEPINQGTALRICLLLLDAAILSQNASRSADVIGYMERVFSVNISTNQADNGSSGHQQQHSTQLSKSSSVSTHSTRPNTSNSESVPIENPTENSLSRTLSEEENLDYDFPSIDQNLLRRLPNPRSSQNQSIDTVDLRLKLHLYKVKLHLLTRNLKAAKREVKMAMNITHGKDHTTALFLKSQLEYAGGNHRKAIKLLIASNNGGEKGVSPMYYNNLGCIYFGLRKYHTASLFFSKALGGKGMNKVSMLVVYNCGIQYLACRKPVPAARCFRKAGLVFYDRPLLWIRIAECCFMEMEKVPEVRVRVYGKGKFRQLSFDDGGDDNNEPNLSVSFARMCLYNALHLLRMERKDKNTPHQEYEEICRKETVAIKQAVLADLAYVELELGNPLKALSAAKMLLSVLECSRAYVFLGHMYAAEALCLLDRLAESSEHLAVYLSEDEVVLESDKQWSVGLEEARGTLYANLAATSAVQGDLERAREFAARAFSALPENPRAVATSIYVDIKCGKTGEAVAKLKQCNRVRFVSGGLTVNGST